MGGKGEGVVAERGFTKGLRHSSERESKTERREGGKNECVHGLSHYVLYNNVLTC